MTSRRGYRGANESGFTLVELLIVVAIIAILAAIAIPQFSAYRERGIRASMVSDARNAAAHANLVFSDIQTYSSLGPIGPGPTTTAYGSGTLFISRGNTVTVTGGAAYSVTVSNAGAGPGKDPLTFTSASCAFADSSVC